MKFKIETDCADYSAEKEVVVSVECDTGGDVNISIGGVEVIWIGTNGSVNLFTLNNEDRIKIESLGFDLDGDMLKVE